MIRRTLALLLLLPAFSVWAQPPATTVQLPTFSLFTVQTTVSVPDGGGVYLGGVDRAASGRVERGVPGAPFRNRGIGSTRSASGMHVSATIIDHKEMDEAILAEAAASRGGAPRAADRPSRVTGDPVAASRGPARDSAGRGDLSVAEIRRRQASQTNVDSGQGHAYFTKAEQAVTEGKAGLAKIYFRMAAARLSGDAAKEARAKAGSITAN